MSEKVVREIYIIRHGETDYNRKGLVQGRHVDAEINERGRRQALAFFRHFSQIRFDALFASTLQRTYQTLEPFAAAGYHIMRFAELDEIDWGIHEGRITDQEAHSEFHRITAQWRQGILEEKIPGGESPRDLQRRQLTFLHDILPLYRGNILICTHGRAMRSLLCTMLRKELSEMDSFPHSNLSLYQLKQINNDFIIEKFNYTRHLEGID